ncbi:MAG TPA: GTPase [Candidatus Limnocylindrales bacterium]|nr:GTPase [Candidatus Limnocylindrales bacterium]
MSAPPSESARAGDAGTQPLPEWSEPAMGGGILGCLRALGEAIEGARLLGVSTEGAEHVRDEARRRLGFPSEAYVLALVGGTGVGKSSLLNALAGTTVSAASVKRPTTGRAVAWIPFGTRDELHGLLDWLGVGEVREHGGLGDAGSLDATDGNRTGSPEPEPTADPLPTVAILDLPDIDSLEPSHRERVEELLPRVDAVAWVVDPEKYHDAVLHDEFLRRWLGSLDRQLIVLNKLDRLAPGDADRVARDLRRDAGRLSGRRVPVPDVVVTSAKTGDLDAFRQWLAAESEAKHVVRARIVASIRAATEELASAAGVDPTQGARALVDPAARRTAIDRATGRVLDVIDLPVLERQAVAATRARARRRGTGPLGMLTSAVYRLSGREARVADPHGHLVRWRDRGSLAAAVAAFSDALADPVRSAAPETRATLAAAVEPRETDAALAGAIDRVVARTPARPPASIVWPILGALQSLATLVVILSAAWIVVWILARPAVDEVVLPLVGRVPVPLALLVGALAAGYLLARLLGLHAGSVGRRWARDLAGEVRSAVGGAVDETAFRRLDRLEAARREVWNATRSIASSCR